MTAPGEGRRGAGAFWAALALAAAVIGSTLTVAAVHETGVGKREVAAADLALQANDWARAILHAKAAAQATAPLSPWPEQGERRLQAIGHDAETRGDATTALHAYGALRAAALSTDATGARASWRKEAEAGLVRVAGWEGTGSSSRVSARKSGERADAAPGDEPADPAPAAMREALAQHGVPPAWPFAALCACTLAFLGAALWMAFGGPGARETRIAQSVLAVAALVSAAVLLAN
jgi:hypothetical protein